MRAIVIAGLAGGAGLLAPGVAGAEVSVGGSVGAGAQGASAYSALELRLDSAWDHAHAGLGVRGVWDGGAFRRSEWTSAWDAVAIVRDAGVSGHVGDAELAIAAGALAPAHVGTLVEGYRVSLDDRWRTGVRAVARSSTLDVTAEVDDVLDPALIAGGARWMMAPPWGLLASLASDPGHVTAFEAGGFRRLEIEHARADLGVSIAGEVPYGASAVAWGNGAIERGDVRFTARADVRAGTGSVGGAFGPLWRVERLAPEMHRGLGGGAGASFGVAAPAGWLEIGGRVRPDRGGIAVASAGAPMGQRVQAAVWAGVGRDEAAGAGELRVAWARSMFSALHVARLYRFDAASTGTMTAEPIWSVTAWFGATSR